MAEFMTRVEVHDDHDYQTLHGEMAKYGFYRVAQATDGRNYMLPTGTYWINSEFNTQAVLGFAQAVLVDLGLSGEITVTQSAETWFAGLPRA